MVIRRHGRKSGLSRIWILLALSLVLAVLAAGCGDSESTTPTDDTVANTGNTTLTTEQWAEYEEVVATFDTANTAAMEKFDTCPRSATGDTTVFARCLGDTLVTLETATRALGVTLASFNGTVTGACAESLAGYTNYTTPYLASIASLQEAIETESTVGLPNAVSTTQQAAAGGKEQREAFEQDCPPG